MHTAVHGTELLLLLLAEAILVPACIVGAIAYARLALNPATNTDDQEVTDA